MARLRGTTAANTLRGGVGNDWIFGDAGADRLEGLEGSDTIRGGAGADTLRGGSGSDVLDGGDGSDLILPGRNAWEDWIEASAGSDVIDFTGADRDSYYFLDYSGADVGRGVVVNIGAASGTARKLAGGTDTFRNLSAIKNGDGAELGLRGGDGDDRITVALGAGRTAQISMSEGNDTVTGGRATIEELLVRSSTSTQFDEFGDRIDEGLPAATIRVNASVGGQMQGVVTNRDGDRTAFSGIDLVAGGGGDDLFLGSAGNDVFAGGRGADAFDGGAGFDTVRFTSSVIFSVTADLATGEVDERWINGQQTRFGETMRSIEALVGGDRSADRFYGAAAANRLEGRGGNDLLHGRAGNDTLVGGEGDDMLTGGVGADRFVFGADDGADRIRGFEDRRDRILINEGAERFSDVEVTDAGRHVLVTFADTSVTLLNVDHRLIGAADFVFV